MKVEENVMLSTTKHLPKWKPQGLWRSFTCVQDDDLYVFQGATLLQYDKLL